MFDTVLIANRGEIALRVARTCREMGIRTVAVYSTADRDSAVVRFADRAIHIGPPAPRRSYLNAAAVVEAALQSGADAIHPGYGFLSEDPDFAEICAHNGIAFVGPPPEVMARLGDKAIARRAMTAAGLPLLPGSERTLDTSAEAQEVADTIGYPVIIKAAAGGGGRGMRAVRDPRDLPRAYRETRAGAQAVFGDGRVYVERYLDSARHVEVQVLCDRYGSGVHLSDRDCSVQRRHQKLIEALRITQDALAPRGVALECRVNAEDPRRGFAPTPGTVTEFVPPGGAFTRVDTHGYPGYEVTQFYDSLLAKVVVWAPDRDQAVARMERALGEFRVAGPGVGTTLGFLGDVLASRPFRTATHTTGLVDHLLAPASPR